MELGYAHLKLDGDWDLLDLADLSRLYTKNYVFLYYLFGSNAETREIYAKYLEHKNYSIARSYRSLYKKIPSEQRLRIEEIHYASPGQITLVGVLVCLPLIAYAVERMASAVNEVHTAYSNIKKEASARELLKQETELRKQETKLRKQETKLNKEQLRFIRESRDRLSEQVGFPPSMLQKLQDYTDHDELTQLKILLSFYRSIKPLAKMQSSGKLKIVNPHNK